VRAGEAFERALALSGSMPPPSAAALRIDALRSLALAARRQRRYNEAASWWQQVLSVGGRPRHADREALEALAIHHEHRLRDLETARAFALGNLDAAGRPSAIESARHRVERLERKLAVRTKGGLERPPLLEQV
jgi:HEAT repeat protein